MGFGKGNSTRREQLEEEIEAAVAAKKAAEQSSSQDRATAADDGFSQGEGEGEGGEESEDEGRPLRAKASTGYAGGDLTLNEILRDIGLGILPGTGARTPSEEGSVTEGTTDAGKDEPTDSHEDMVADQQPHDDKATNDDEDKVAEQPYHEDNATNDNEDKLADQSSYDDKATDDDGDKVVDQLPHEDRATDYVKDKEVDQQPHDDKATTDDVSQGEGADADERRKEECNRLYEDISATMESQAGGSSHTPAMATEEQLHRIIALLEDDEPEGENDTASVVDEDHAKSSDVKEGTVEPSNKSEAEDKADAGKDDDDRPDDDESK